MLSNSRQASASRKRRGELLRVSEEAPPNRRSSYLELAEEIGRELEEYEAICSGAVNLFSVQEIDDLGEVLVKARLDGHHQLPRLSWVQFPPDTRCLVSCDQQSAT